jgi:hypothetical protein
MTASAAPDFKPAPPERTVIVASLDEKWGRHFEPGTPKHAMTWRNTKQRATLMFDWRCAVMNKFECSARVLRVAWLLDCLFWKLGYCYATDAYIGEKLGIQLNHVQAALAKLEKDGAIIRASSYVRRRAQRRIWPSAQIVPPTAGGIHTPHGGTRDTPHGGGTDSIGKKPTSKSVRISTTAEAARRDAERRELRRAPQDLAGRQGPEAAI